VIADADRDDVVWLAGLLEGEGTFDLHRGKYPRVRVAMTDRDVVGRAATLFGSSIRLTLRTAPHRPMWHAEIQGQKAVLVMRAVLPFMGARRSAKIAEILSAHGLSANGPGYGQAYGFALNRPPGLLSPSA
jgi:hypothetical protein